MRDILNPIVLLLGAAAIALLVFLNTADTTKKAGKDYNRAQSQHMEKVLQRGTPTLGERR